MFETSPEKGRPETKMEQNNWETSEVDVGEVLASFDNRTGLGPKPPFCFNRPILTRRPALEPNLWGVRIKSGHVNEISLDSTSFNCSAMRGF